MAQLLIGHMQTKGQVILRLTTKDHAIKENPADAIGCGEHINTGVFAYTYTANLIGRWCRMARPPNNPSCRGIQRCSAP
ncbi:hypothetical protein LA080_002427 [Diaporthe eres]|nr:hypothetical protein LA080_002427 [Diaporthe eres]